MEKTAQTMAYTIAWAFHVHWLPCCCCCSGGSCRGDGGGSQGVVMVVVVRNTIELQVDVV